MHLLLLLSSSQCITRCTPYPLSWESVVFLHHKDEEEYPVYSIVGGRGGVLLLSSSCWRMQPTPRPPSALHHRQDVKVKAYDTYSIARRRGEVDGILLLSSLLWSTQYAPHLPDGGYSLLARPTPPLLLFSSRWSPRHTLPLPQP